MGLLFVTAFRYIKNQKRHTVLTVIGIVLSVILMVVSFAAVNTVTATRKNVVADQNGSYHVLFNDVTKDQIITISNMDIFERSNRYGVSAYINTYYTDLTELGIDDIYYLSGTDNEVLSASFLRIDAKACDMLPSYITALYDGRLPENDGEIVLAPADCARFGDPAPGDTVTFLRTGCVPKGTGDSAEITESAGGLEVPARLSEYYDVRDVREISFTVVGRSKNYSMISYSDSKMGSFAAQPEKLLLCYTDEANDYYWDMHHAFQDVGLEIDDFDFTFNQEYLNMVNKGVEAKSYNAIFYALVYMGILFLMFCVRMVIDNSFEISSHERIRQFGVLRAVGASKKQILGILSSEALILAMMGVPVGLLLGAGVSRLIYGGIASLEELSDISTSYDLAEMMEFSLTPVSMISSAVIGVFWVLISAVGTGMRVNKMSPIQAIRAAEKRTKVREPEKKADIDKLGVEKLIAFRSLRRNNKRFIITVLSIAMSITAFVCLSYAVEAIRGRISEMYSESQSPYEFEITYSDIYHEGAGETVKQMTETGLFSQVQYDSYLQFIAYTDENLNEKDSAVGYYYLQIHPINEMTYIKLTGRDDFDEFESSGKIIINNLKRDGSMLYNTAPETVTAAPFINLNLFDDENFDVFALFYSDIRPYAYENGFAAGCIAESAYSGYVAKYGADSSVAKYNVNDSELYVYVRTIYAQPAEGMRDDAALWLERRFYDNFKNNYSTEHMLRSFVKLAHICGYIAIGLITLIAVVNVVNIISTNVLNRTAEIGMLRACGMSSKQIFSMIFSESAFYAGFSSLCALLAVEGVLLVIMIPFFIGRTFTMDDLPVKISFIAPLKYVLIGAAASFVAALASALPAVKRIIDIPIVEAVESIE